MTGPFVPSSSSGADDGARSRARADLVWYLRHADALARWPVLSEPWAQSIERRRLDRSGENLTASSFSMGGR
jgi:hypothetical protein